MICIGCRHLMSYAWLSSGDTMRHIHTLGGDLLVMKLMQRASRGGARCTPFFALSSLHSQRIWVLVRAGNHGRNRTVKSFEFKCTWHSHTFFKLKMQGDHPGQEVTSYQKCLVKI